MFKKILIANRGEIACRVIKTARKMGIQTVAVYSETDRNAQHVYLADEAVAIGPSPAAQSYLVIENIIAACKATGAQAVHPGYGFLSENAAFCEALKKEGITFIGPDVPAIVSMGDKMASKRLAAEAGVSTVPGHDDLIKDAEDAVKVAAQIGYPVMIKASAGGGGKGMRTAFNEKECRDGFVRAKNEAASSFGDDRILIEKFIEQPRHIEIQVMADGHGNCIYLWERECSVQRRHQKIIEEAPSPFLDEATRRAMGEQAVALAKAVDYKSAGTVEFIVDANRNFYFLEMNTRLQVEHPVTEMITGLDLVELMLRVAAGEVLPLTQDQVQLKGWAMESRIYAEDPVRDFMPSIGRLSHYIEPEETDHVRVDSGIVEGNEVSIYYDPMLAKLVTYGATREEAIGHMQTALDAFFIRGIQQNISFLGAILAHERFRRGALTTNFIADEYPEGFRNSDVPLVDADRQIIMGAVIHNFYRHRAHNISGQFRDVEQYIDGDWVVIMDGKHHPVYVEAVKGGAFVRLNGKDFDVRTDWKLGQPLLKCQINGIPLVFQVERTGLQYHVRHHGAEHALTVLSPLAAEMYKYMPEKKQIDTGKMLLSPMPGLVIKLSVTEGQVVKAGEELAVVEAMKMENILVASQDCTIARTLVALGDSVAVDQVLIEFE